MKQNLRRQKKMISDSTCWGKLYTNFFILGTKFRCTCEESYLHGNVLNCQNIMSTIWYGKTRVTSCESQVTSYELKA